MLYLLYFQFANLIESDDMYWDLLYLIQIKFLLRFFKNVIDKFIIQNSFLGNVAWSPNSPSAIVLFYYPNPFSQNICFKLVEKLNIRVHLKRKIGKKLKIYLIFRLLIIILTKFC